MAGGKDASQPLQKLPVAPVILWAPNNLGLGGAAQTKEVPRAMPVCSWQPRRPSFWSRFLLLCLVRGEDRKWEHGALDTFFVETWEPVPFLAPRPPQGVSAPSTASSNPARRLPCCQQERPASRPDVAGLVGTNRAATSGVPLRGAEAADLWPLWHPRRGPLSAPATAFRASLH